ncbi:hypothetical protein BGZ52_010439, partial [Haplosporangium bisporale]
RSICCILLTAGGLFFELIMPPLAWPGLAFSPSIPTSPRRSLAPSIRNAWAVNLTPSELSAVVYPHPLFCA